MSRYHQTLTAAYVLCAVSTLTACGGGSGDDKPVTPVSFTVTATAGSGGSISPASRSVQSGQTTTFTVTPDGGHSIDTVTGCGGSLNGNTYTTGSITAACTVSASFSKDAVLTVSVASSATVKEKHSITITATATDDTPGLGYHWSQLSGPDLTLTGTTTASVELTAPAVDADATAVLRVTVTDSAEQTASADVTVTITQVETTFTLSGTISEAAFANASVSAVLAGTTFNATADANGVFSLLLKADDDETNLFARIIARSATSAGLEYYSFVQQLNADAETTNGVSVTTGSARLLADVNSNVIGIHAVSTALYALIVQANGGEVPTDLDTLTLVEKSVSPDELIEAAAVVKLLTQGGDFALPEGVANVLELLTDTEAYNSYVEAAEATQEGIIASTINEVINDPELTPPVDEDSLASTYFETYPAASGFLPKAPNTSRFDFGSNGKGTQTSEGGVSRFNWALEEGLLVLNYTDTAPMYTYLATVAGGWWSLTQEQVDTLNANGIYQVEVKVELNYKDFKRITTGSKIDTWRIETGERRTMTPITLVNGDVISIPEYTYHYTWDRLMINGDKLEQLQFTTADMPGHWLIERFYQPGTFQSGNPATGIFADVLEVAENGSGVALEKDVAFTWTIDGAGTFAADLEDGTRLEVVKLDQSGTDMQVFVTVFNAEGELIGADGDYAIKLDGSDFKTYELTNDEHHYWQTTVNQWRKTAWDGNRLLWDHGGAYFGFQLLNDGGGYGMQNYDFAPPAFTPVFNQPLTWTKEEISDNKEVLQLNRFACWDDSSAICTRRDWRLLKTSEGILGRRIYVLEAQYSRPSSTSDEFFISNGLGHRLNIYEEIPFSYWNDTAQNPDNLNLPLATSQAVKGKPTLRLLVEPNPENHTNL